MAWVDWAIVILIAMSVLGGLSQGFFRSVCSLGGLFLGLVLAAWNYDRVAAILAPWVHAEALADTLGFLFVALLVMGVAGIVGHGVGLSGQAGGRGFRLSAGCAAGDPVHPGDHRLFPPRPLAGGGAAAKIFFWRLPFEYPHEPGGTGRAGAGRFEDAGAGIALVAASRKQQIVTSGTAQRQELRQSKRNKRWT